MKTEELFNVIGEIDDDMITKAKSTVSDTLSGQIIRRSWKPFAALAACLAVVIIGAAVIIGVNTHKNAIKSVDSGSNSGNSEIKAAEYPENAKYQYTGDFSELTPASYGIVDRMVFGYFDDLAKSSSLIVVGTFVDDARQDVPLTGKITWDSRSASLLPGASYNKLRVDRVFKGDVEAGSQIVIRGNYYVNEGELAYVYGAASTPMIKGEQWVYFLSKTDPENGDYYVSLGCNDGRFFVPGNENTFVLEELREYLDGDYSAYEDVKIMLGEPGGVERLGTKSWLKDTGEFVLPEFPAVTFVRSDGSISVYGTEQVIIRASDIDDVYFADLDGDGRREIVCKCSLGENWLSANYIKAYDIANNMSYVLKDELARYSSPNSYDPEIRDEVMYVVKTSNSGGQSSADKLTLDMMTSAKIDGNKIFYNGKTYNIVNTLTTKDGVTFTMGLTKPEYEAGEYVEVIGVVENGSDKEIGLKMPVDGEGTHTEIGTYIRHGDNVVLEDPDTALANMALSSRIIVPGETYFQAMRFETRKERLNDKDTIIPLCVDPLGAYGGVAYIQMLEDPYEILSKVKGYELDFTVNIVPRESVQYPNSHVFTMDEFGNNVEFKYSDSSLAVKNGSEEFELFTDMQIKNMYLLDLNGDGKREIVANISDPESGISRITAYEPSAGKLYDLCDPGHYNYRMSVTVGYEGGYYISAKKFRYSSAELAAQPVRLTLDVMKEVTAFSDDRKKPVTGASEITELGSSFTMEEFPDKMFYYADRMLKYTDKDGKEEELFNTKIENVYLYDLNADGRREVIIKGYCNVFNGNTSTTKPDAAKIISAIDLENMYVGYLYPYAKEFSLAIIGDDLYMVIDGETDPEPLTFERFEELAKSPYI